jgi:hypothetical protein
MWRRVCKTWGFGSDYEECRLLGYDDVYVICEAFEAVAITNAILFYVTPCDF